MHSNSIYNFIDLFCGAGGLSYGFEKAGFYPIYAVESNSTYARTYSLNNENVEIFVGNIETLTEDSIKQKFENLKVDLIIGGPPCQGFSMAGKFGRRFLDDERNKLFKEFFKFVKIIKPKIFVIENVANLLRHNKGKTIEEIISIFETIGYSVNYKILNSKFFNVPQERRRIFIVGTLKDIFFSFPLENQNILTIKDAIDDLPKLGNGEKSNVYLHNSMNHSADMIEKMKYVKDGGNRNDIPLHIRPKTGDARKYIKYNSNKPSICITGDMRKVFHYSQNRALTCRELARIQTFPDDYLFSGTSIEIQQQIGNAVPCNLAYYVAKACKESLDCA